MLKYLKGIVEYCLCYQGSDLKIEGYLDVNWARNPDGNKSTFGYVFLLNGGAIIWFSKKQSCVALSTIEAKFVTCSIAMQDAILLKRFLTQRQN